jgi:hypothetical protein
MLFFHLVCIAWHGGEGSEVSGSRGKGETCEQSSEDTSLVGKGPRWEVERDRVGWLSGMRPCGRWDVVPNWVWMGVWSG